MYLKLGDRVETPDGEGFVQDLLPDGVIVVLNSTGKSRMYDYQEVMKI